MSNGTRKRTVNRPFLTDTRPRYTAFSCNRKGTATPWPSLTSVDRWTFLSNNSIWANPWYEGKNCPKSSTTYPDADTSANAFKVSVGAVPAAGSADPFRLSQIAPYRGTFKRNPGSPRSVKRILSLLFTPFLAPRTIWPRVRYRLSSRLNNSEKIESFITAPSKAPTTRVVESRAIAPPVGLINISSPALRRMGSSSRENSHVIVTTKGRRCPFLNDFTSCSWSRFSEHQPTSPPWPK